jgi:hypothetical protein
VEKNLLSDLSQFHKAFTAHVGLASRVNDVDLLFMRYSVRISPELPAIPSDISRVLFSPSRQMTE